MKIFGVPTKVEGSFFVLTAFLAFSRLSVPLLLVEWMVLVLVSVFLHELGHALAARSFGLSPSITLYSMGGLTSWPSAENLSPPRDIVISLAGPLTGLLVGGLVFMLSPLFVRPGAPNLLLVAYYDILWINVGWGLFNLLPMLPLDGGNVLRALEEWFSGRKEIFVAPLVSLLVALGIALYAVSTGWLWVVFLGGLFAYTNGSYLFQKLRTRSDRKLRPLLEQAREALGNKNYAEAAEIIRRVLGRAGTGELKSEATRLLIFLHIEEGNYEKAAEELNRLQVIYGNDPYLEGLVALERGEAAKAVPGLKAAFEAAPSKELGALLNRALILERRFEEALVLCGHPAMKEVRRPLCVNLQLEAFGEGAFEVSARAGQQAFEEEPDVDIAYNVGCAFARDSHIEASLKWLERAVDSGFSNRELFASDPDLDSLRHLPEFKRIEGRLGGAEE
jgi:Zn-dependent protease